MAGTDDRGEDGRRARQPANLDPARVEDGDDGDGSDVVDDGEGEEEDLEPDRGPPAEDGEDSDGEGDVGGHGNPPAPSGVAASHHGQEHQRGDHHAARRGHGRERGSPPVPQFPDGDLPLDLEADEEEEDGHDGVVDPVLEILTHGPGPGADDDLGVPQVDVAVLPRAVGPDQRDGSGHEEERATAGFGPQELG